MKFIIQGIAIKMEYKIATLSIFDLTVSGIIVSNITSSKAFEKNRIIQ